MYKNRMTRVALLLVVGLAAAAMPAAAQKAYDEITFPPMNDFELPQVERVTLANGMKLYLVEDHELPLVSANARIRVGSVFDPADKIGLASLTGTVMRTGGTASISGDDLDVLLESIGASVETNIGTTSGSAGMSVLKEDVDTGLKILADVLMNPEFPDEKIDLAKVTERSAISRRNDDPMGIAQREYSKLIYGASSPYVRHTEYGTIDAITRDDLVAFHGKYFQPNNVMLALVGDFDTKEMVKKVEKAFSGWKQTEIDFPALPQVDYDFKATVNEIAKDDANQSVIVMGHMGIKRDNPDYFNLIVMNQILGAGGFSSRLFQEVRSRLGLAYAVGGVLTAQWEYPGPFFVFCMTKSETTIQAIRAMQNEVDRMTQEMVTAEELKLAQDAWLNAFVFNFDSKSEIVNRMMTYDYYGFPEDYLQKTKEGVETTTTEDVLRVAKKYLHPDALQVMVVGKSEDFDEPLSTLGTVNAVDISIPEPGEDLPEASAEDLSAGGEVMAMAVEACGGADAVSKVENYQIKANAKLTLGPQAMDITITSVTVFPDKSASVLVLPFGEVKQVLAGDAGWAMSPQENQDMKGSDLDDMKAGHFRDWIGLMKGVVAGDYTVRHMGTEDVTDPGSEAGATQAAEVLSISDGTNSVKVYLHASTHMPVAMAYRGRTPMGPAAMQEFYSMWKDAGGVMVPYKTVTYADGKEFVVSRVTSATTNAEVDGTLFEKP